MTFNLADAMPAGFREELRAERRMRIAELERLKQRATSAEMHAIDRIIQERAEECLDRGSGACWMRDPRIADLVADALLHFDQSRSMSFSTRVTKSIAFSIHGSRSLQSGQINCSAAKESFGRTTISIGQSETRKNLHA